MDRDEPLRCDHCRKAEPGAERLADGWELLEITDPIRGTDLVRKWVAMLCPDCARAERSSQHKAGER